MIEIWKDVVGYEGLYQVSDLGRIKSLIRKFTNDQVLAIISLNSKNLSPSEMARQTDIGRTSVRRILKNPQKYLNQEIILQPVKESHGYLRVALYKNNKRKEFKVHKLVLETFIGPCPEGMECRHLNGIRTDNRLCNLKWGTGKENCQDAINHKTFQMGSKHYLSKLEDNQIKEIRKLTKEGRLTLKEIGKRFSVSVTTISDIKNKKIYKSVS